MFHMAAAPERGNMIDERDLLVALCKGESYGYFPSVCAIEYRRQLLIFITRTALSKYFISKLWSK
jgi:hypothetical protein